MIIWAWVAAYSSQFECLSLELSTTHPQLLFHPWLVDSVDTSRCLTQAILSLLPQLLWWLQWDSSLPVSCLVLVGATLWADSGSSGFAGGSASLKGRCASLNTSVFLVHSLLPAYGLRTPSASVSSPHTYCLLSSFPTVTDSYLNLEPQARIGSF